jgi:hypothetical protein
MAPNKERNLQKLAQFTDARRIYLEDFNVALRSEHPNRAIADCRATLFRVFQNQYPQTEVMEISPKQFIKCSGFFSQRNIADLGPDQIVPNSLIQQIDRELEKSKAKKIDIPQDCPDSRFEEMDGEDGVYYCDAAKNLETIIIDQINVNVFKITDEKGIEVRCPRGFRADETGVPCFCAAPQARELQKPLNRLMATINEIGAEFNRQGYTF